MDINLLVRDSNGNTLNVTESRAYGLMSGNVFGITEIAGIPRDRVASARAQLGEFAVIVTLDLLPGDDDGV